MTSITGPSVIKAVVILLMGMAVDTSTVLTVDLREGTKSPLPEGISWHSLLAKTSNTGVCDVQGVLKLNFDKVSRVRAQINMTFEQSVGWTFDLGDSSTVNGWAGDAGTQQNDAEVHSIDHALFFYGRDDRVNGGSTGLLHYQSDFVGVNPYTTLTLDVKDEQLRASNGVGFVHVQSYNLFQLNGQSDAGGVNYDLYLGMNRVVDGNYRAGVGLCSVSIQFFPS